MLQHNVIGNIDPLEQALTRNSNERDAVAIAKEKWAKKRLATTRTATRAATRETGEPVKQSSPGEAPLLTQPQTNDVAHLAGCIKQRIARMEQLLIEQDARTGTSRKADRLNEMLSPAMRSVIRGRERMLRCLQEQSGS